MEAQCLCQDARGLRVIIDLKKSLESSTTGAELLAFVAVDSDGGRF